MGAKPTPAEPRPPEDLSRLYLAVTEKAPVPMAMVEGASHIVRYVNPAFCRLIDKPKEQLVGKPFSQAVPEQDEWVPLLDGVFRTGQPVNHTAQENSDAQPVFWSYLMWPIIENEHPVGATIQVTGRSQSPKETTALNEALMPGAVRQPELTQASDAAKALLHAEIGERRQMDAALRASELNYRRLFEAATNGILILEAESGCINDLNPFLIKMLGFSRAELVGKPIWELRPFKEIVSSRSELAKLQQQGSVRFEPLPLETKAGARVAVEFVSNVYQAGVRTMIQCNIRDITERKQAELTAVRLASIVESSDDAIIGKDTNGIITNWNKGAEKIFGYSATEIVGTSIMRLIPADRQGEEEQILKTIRAGGSVQHFETQRQTKDGRLLDISVTASPIKTASGKVIGVSKVARDISDRKRTEQALRKSEGRTHAIVQSSLDCIITIDHEGKILEFNPAAERVFGYARAKVLGMELAEVMIPPSQRVSHRQGLMSYLATGDAKILGRRIEFMALRSDGSEFPIELAITRLGTEEPPTFTGFIRDITERKQAEDEVRRLNGELERRVAQRTAQLQNANQELEAFSYSVSHDLRAPLRHVLGFVDLLRQDAGPVLSEKSLQYLGTISHAARRMGNLIDDLLSFSRIGKAEMQRTEVNLDQLVQETSGEFQAETKERKVVWEIHPVPVVWADRALLRLVLVNLISNAVKFTGHRPQPKIEIGCAPGGDGETVIFVRDNGAGFNPRYASKLFGVFQRLHSQAEFEGTGIGLANVQRIIHRHGGRTWAEGVVDGGATFYFSIPNRTEA